MKTLTQIKPSRTNTRLSRYFVESGENLTLTADLKEKYSSLWVDMVHHSFVNEMGNGTLPPEKFRRYFLQDYVFVKDLVTMSGQAIA